MDFYEYLNLYINISGLTFVIGTIVYIYNTDNIKESMGLFVFIWCNTILAFLWFLSLPYIFYISFIKKEEKEEEGKQ